MADNNNDESMAIHSVRMPMVDGTHTTFQVWWMRFTAFAIVHRFKAAINPEGTEEDLPTMEPAAIPVGTDGAPTRAAVRRNSVADDNLTLGPELRTVGPHPGGQPNNSMAIWIGMASGSGLASTIYTS